MGAKMSDLLQFTATIVSGIAIAMAKGRQLTLVLMTVVMADAVAQESLSNIRTVHSFNSVHYFVAKYNC
ncbi:hypothetical protein KRP22_012774 [Phytophthora ramorum]|nr:hypothetical protein KRP22_8798 [Phytophthora ramorum]